MTIKPGREHRLGGLPYLSYFRFFSDDIRVVQTPAHGSQKTDEVEIGTSEVVAVHVTKRQDADELGRDSRLLHHFSNRRRRNILARIGETTRELGWK